MGRRQINPVNVSSVRKQEETEQYRSSFPKIRSSVVCKKQLTLKFAFSLTEANK